MFLSGFSDKNRCIFSYSISKSKMTRRRAADSRNNTAGEADKVSLDLEMELTPF
jgi:hypothetical protein